jgi:pimeloyl-ACP methyl ester carboxylesterase
MRYTKDIVIINMEKIKNTKKIIFFLFVLVVCFFNAREIAAAGPTIVDASIITIPTTWSKAESPYIINSSLTIDTNALTIEPGAVIKVAGTASIYFDKGITVKGTVQDKVIFTSFKDDAVFGDTNEDGDISSPAKSDWNGIVVRGSAKFEAENIEISYAKVGLSMECFPYDLKNVSIKDSLINKNFIGIKINKALPVVEGNTISNNSYGIFIVTDWWGSDAKVTNNSIADNLEGIRVNSPVSGVTHIDARNNWWGDKSGPYFKHSTYGNDNLDGTGNAVSEGVLFDPWLGSNLIKSSADCQENCNSNVLFLPGFESSRLYARDDPNCLFLNCENQLWEPNRNADVEKLFLDVAGRSTDKYDIYTRDVLDEANVLPLGQENFYKSFIAEMNDMKNKDKKINDWHEAVYDWRLSFDDILKSGKKDGSNISYNQQADSPYLISELKRLAQSSKTGKVTIVAHSNGGLVAKALLQKIGDEETAKLVDKIIFVAVPQIGTPAAVAGLLHGEDQNFFPVLSTKNARGFGENMPSAYNLLPSANYFSVVENPVFNFKTEESADWKNLFYGAIDSKKGMDNFLRDDFRRVSSIDSDVNTPAMLNKKLLSDAETVHADLDFWTAPAGIRVIQIAGWGVPKTLSSTEYGIMGKAICDNLICQLGADYLNPNFIFTIDGDGTVVTPSALWMNGAERYWIDLKKYNTNHRLGTVFGWLSLNHANILEIQELNSFIGDIINNKTKELSEYTYISAKVPLASNEKRLQYSLHSPLTLEIYDDQGRHTGISADGQIEEQIPGTYFKQFGDVKYIFADENSASHIKMQGYETGTFTFAVEEFRGDESLGKVIFKDVPTTAETKVSFDVATDLESSSNLKIDKNGDGIVELNLAAKIGEIVVFDAVAPVTSSSLSGPLGQNDWYLGDVSLILSAQDNESGSGIEKIEYSLDNGTTWRTYDDPIVFVQEGIFNVFYFATDKQGNAEDAKTITIKIDKTAPEAKIQFNTETQKIDVIGADNLSQNVAVQLHEKIISGPEYQKEVKRGFWLFHWNEKELERKTIVTATLTDEAGHKTEIAWEQKINKNRHIDIEVFSLLYDGQKIEISPSSLEYQWMQNGERKTYAIFTSDIENESLSVESRYIAKKDLTLIREKEKQFGDDENDEENRNLPLKKRMSGMVIPGIMTEKGRIRIDY